MRDRNAEDRKMLEAVINAMTDDFPNDPDDFTADQGAAFREMLASLNDPKAGPAANRGKYDSLTEKQRAWVSSTYALLGLEGK